MWWNAPQLEQPQAVLDLHDTQSGRLFMLGAGPSLNKQLDLLPQLAGKTTWGVNFLPQWKDLPFDLTYYSISEQHHVNRHGIDQFEWPGHNMARFAFNWQKVRRPWIQWVAKAPNDITIRNSGFFGLDSFLPPVPGGAETVLTALQLACWMGFEEICLLGNEFTKSGYAWDATATRRSKSRRSAEQTAFIARASMETHGRRLIDCTPSGRLSLSEALEYVPLENILADKG